MFSDKKQLGLQYYIKTSISVIFVTPALKQQMINTLYLDHD